MTPAILTEEFGKEIGLAGLQSGRLMTPAILTEEFGKACAFLRGTPGRRVSCSIYESRPDVCRRYAPGSKNCRAVRAELGL